MSIMFKQISINEENLSIYTYIMQSGREDTLE